MRQMIWPEKRSISDDEILAWARDVIADEKLESEYPNLTIEDAEFILTDHGDVTFARRANEATDAAYESEAFLRNMEGYGDYEGSVTWP